MTSLAEMTYGARELIRDFPIFFEAEQGPLNTLTIRLEHPYVSSALQVFATDTSVSTPVTTAVTAWDLDERNGLLKLTDATILGKRILVAGYHYKWFTDSDIARHVSDVVSEFTHSSGGDVGDLSEVESDVAQIGAVVRALWSLSIELALDIDVSTPEGMFIPAHQRFAQVMQMVQYWEKQFEEKSASLNVGLGSLEIFRLRRVSKLTNRYIPVYRDRELEDPYRPQRVYPDIPDLAMGTPPEYDAIEVAESYRAGGRYYSSNYPAMQTSPGYGSL